METITIPKKEYIQLREDSKIVEALIDLDAKVAKSILKSMKEAAQGRIERVF
jgi:hypothetical protein